MLCRAPLASPGAHSLNVRRSLLLISTVRAGGQLDESVERDGEPGAVLLVLLHEVGINAADDGLVTDDEDVLTALELHDDGFEADNYIAVGLTTTVAVVVLVLVARCKVLRVAIFDLLVCKAVANPGVELVKCLPLELVIVLWEKSCSRDRSLQSRGPDREGSIVLQRDRWLAEGPIRGINHAKS